MTIFYSLRLSYFLVFYFTLVFICKNSPIKLITEFDQETTLLNYVSH